MVLAKAEYEVCDEFVEIARKLIDRHPDQFFGKPIDSLRAMLVINKVRPETKKRIDVKCVPMPMALDCPYKFYAIIHESDWETYSEAQKARAVCWTLETIPESEDSDKLITPDLKDHSVMVRTFGVDWIDDPSAPNPLTDNVVWSHRGSNGIVKDEGE